VLGLALAVLGGAGVAGADVWKGGYRFANNAFADAAVADVPDFTLVPSTVSLLSAAVSGPDMSSWVKLNTNGIIEVNFQNHQLTNLAGDDLAIFEAEAVNHFAMAVFTSGHDQSSISAYQEILPVPVGTVDGHPMNMASVNLDSFGVAAGGEVSWIILKSLDQQGCEIAGAAAHPVVDATPEPSTLAFLTLGGLGVLCMRRGVSRAA
jgi:hypothetical protein